jgi:hypothetical protein
VIEDLIVRKELWTPVDLTGKQTGEPQERLVCAYFPPHIEVTTDLLENSDPSLLNTENWTGPEEIDTSEGSLRVSQLLNITLDNGGAQYLLGLVKDNGNREGWLWKLTPGRTND